MRVARSDELHGNGPFSLSVGGVDVVVVRTAAGLRAFQGRCPHQGALLGEGEIDGDALVCRNHRWRYSLETGRRQGGPECLASHPVVERDGQVFVEVGSAAGPSVSAARRSVRDLPGPKGVPVLGNLPQLDVNRLHEVLEAWSHEYGPIYAYRMAWMQVVVVSDPELAAQVLRARPETFSRLSNVAPVFKETGVAGVFSAEGAAWRAQRRLTMEALSHRHLRGFYPTLKTIAGRLQRRWLGARGPLDIVDELKRFTVDVTTLLTFGHDVNTLEQGDDVIQRHLELIFPALNTRLFALMPTWRWVRMPKDRRLDRAVGELHAWLGELIARARARNGSTAGQAPANFLEAMLAARDETGQPFSDEVIKGNLMTMLLAGEDTTAFTLAWAVHHLCDGPQAVSALRREIDAVAGPSGVPADIETANRLAYAGGVANEALRLRPVAPVLFNEANVDTVVGDVHLPARTIVVTMVRPPVHDPEHFEDPLAFRPERWIVPQGAHEPQALMPFGSGPRLCPGRTLALLEMKVVLSALYGKFDVERDGDGAAVRERFAFTMYPEGLRVRLRPRA